MLHCFTKLYFIFQAAAVNQVASETQKQLEIQRIQQEHLKRQQELILQQQHNIQELQNQISSQYASGKGLPGLPSPQSLMFLSPFLEQLQLTGRLPPSIPQIPPGTKPNALPTHVSKIFNMGLKYCFYTTSYGSN